jgi:hypothetical protein
MKLIISFVGGVVVGAIVFGTALGLLGYVIGAGKPSVIVRNLTQFPITYVRIETSAGESYALSDIGPATSARAEIAGGDKAVWLTLTTSTGQRRKSEQIYVPGQGTVFIAVTDQSITMDSEL